MAWMIQRKKREESERKRGKRGMKVERKETNTEKEFQKFMDKKASDRKK